MPPSVAVAFSYRGCESDAGLVVQWLLVYHATSCGQCHNVGGTVVQGLFFIIASNDKQDGCPTSCF
jgi:mono/diheme cytochrome c family protein